MPVHALPTNLFNSTCWSIEVTKFIDLTDKTFGRLTVIERALSGARWRTRWRCRCECGTENTVFAVSLRRGATTSCGCLMRERSREHSTTHGLSESAEYYIWCAIKSRCLSLGNKQHADYGGRGIDICGRWENSFEDFLADMGTRPSPKHQIDRIDNNGGYTPKNCRWVSGTENARNTRTSMWWDILGIRYASSTEAGESLGVCPRTIRDRVKRGVPGYSSSLKYPR